jgi:hypothetical protein
MYGTDVEDWKPVEKTRKGLSIGEKIIIKEFRKGKPYMILRSLSTEAMENHVKIAMAMGYRPEGGISAVPQMGLLQAMVLKDPRKLETYDLILNPPYGWLSWGK